MKFLKFTYVDSITGIPLTESYAKNGVVVPNGITPVFDIQETRSTSAPHVYGIAEDTFVHEVFGDFIREVDESSFFETLKNELKDRVREKRKEVEQSGFTVSGYSVSTEISDQNRIAAMASVLLVDSEMLNIDFESSPGVWVTLPRDVALQIAIATGRHVQNCFSWSKMEMDKIDELDFNIETLGSIRDTLESINMFGSPEEVEQETVL